MSTILTFAQTQCDINIGKTISSFFLLLSSGLEGITALSGIWRCMLPSLARMFLPPLLQCQDSIGSKLPKQFLWTIGTNEVRQREGGI